MGQSESELTINRLMLTNIIFIFMPSDSKARDIYSKIPSSTEFIRRQGTEPRDLDLTALDEMAKRELYPDGRVPARMPEPIYEVKAEDVLRDGFNMPKEKPGFFEWLITKIKNLLHLA